MRRSILSVLAMSALSCGLVNSDSSTYNSPMKHYMAAHRTTRYKNAGPKATKGKRHASLKSRSNKRK